MNTANHKARVARSGRGCLALLCLALALVTASPASAAFEQTGTFGGSGEDVQLGGVGSLAVNHTGAGGVDKGTVYAATRFGPTTWILRYGPQGQGLKFLERWQVTPQEEAYERCGPALGESGGIVEHPCTTHVEASPGTLGIAVDQATGNVYILNGELHGIPEARLITVYKPDGSSVVARFGKRAEDFPPKPFSETAGEFHDSAYPGGIAVTDTGKVYAFDVQNSGSFNSRLMVFEPETPGDYSQYEYSGEVLAGTLSQHDFPAAPVLDAAGNIYTQNGVEGITISVFPPQTPAPFPAPAPPAPTCSFTYSKAGIYGMTVNPLTREVFFYSYKTPKRVRRLGPCDPISGKFTEIAPEPEAFGVAPERGDLSALSVDPKRQLLGRDEGVLYGAAPGPVPNSGVGKGQPGQTSLGYIFAAALEEPPAVSEESVSNVTSTSARVRASISPEGHSTGYQVEYLTESAYQEDGESFESALKAPASPVVLGSTSGQQAAAVTLTGLAPGTEYRYRVVATSTCKQVGPVCEGTGEAEVLRTFPAGVDGLQNGRAYELVSPAEKHGGQVYPADPRVGSNCPETQCKPGATSEHFPMQTTSSGERIVFEGSAFGPGEGALVENEYRAVRTSGGWLTTNLTPPLLLSKNRHTGYKGFDSALTQGVLEQVSPSLSPGALPDFANLYSQPAADPLSLTPVFTAATSPHCSAGVGSGSLKLSYAGAASDLSHVFFAANDALTPEAPGGCGPENLYDWSPATGVLRLVNLLPDNATAVPDAAFGEGNANSVSDDGSRVFWSGPSGQVYLRADGTHTIEIGDPAKFLAASAQGDQVLLDDGCLYDIGQGDCQDLTRGLGILEGLVGRSRDLSHVYFLVGPVKGTGNLTSGSASVAGVNATAGKFAVGQIIEGPGIPAGATVAAVGPGTLELSAPATASGAAVSLVAQGMLAEGEANSEGAEAQVNGINLYAWTSTATRFVATLPKEKSLSSAGASANGEFLVFPSKAPLTGYNNIGPCESNHAEGFDPGPCSEAYVYDLAHRTLACASCNPSNAPPLGKATLREIAGEQPYIPQPHYLADSGRLLFDTQDSLSPGDSNGGVEDVYEWTPAGVGGCTSGFADGGCVSLISAGTGPVDSNLLAMDLTGKNVFFTTRDRLVSADRDELVDLYDAREGGGFPVQPAGPGSGCQGEACQPSPTIPSEQPIGSSGVTGQGIPTRKGCPKGKVKKKGKCVKKKSGRKKHRSKKHRNHRKGK